VQPGIPTNTTYEDTLQALEDQFRDQNFATAYRCQLTTRTQKAGESLQDFATAIELLAHCAYPTLPEDHTGREAGKLLHTGYKPRYKNSTAARRGEDGKRGPQTGTRTTGRTHSRQAPLKNTKIYQGS
jgi:hypothetical protein